MKTIFIPQMPESITDITTNSSSEIFIIGADKEISVVNQLIINNGWDWWFGEPKTFENEDQVRDFCTEYYYCLERLLPVPPAPSFYRYYGNGHTDISSEMAKINSEIEELYKQARQKGRDEDADKKLRALYIKQDEQRKKEISKYVSSLNLKSFVGLHYYECGEDNELSEESWGDIHKTVPGNYARIG
jgi:hypothetical protein